MGTDVTGGVSGALCWTDHIIDDVPALVRRLVDAARAAGAEVHEQVGSAQPQFDGQVLKGIANTSSTSAPSLVQGRVVVNATGPWASAWLAQGTASFTSPFAGVVGGMNLLLKREPDTEDAVGLVSRTLPGHPDRLIFLVPFHGRLLAGAYYCRRTGVADQPTATDEDIDGFLEVLNDACPSGHFKRNDIDEVLFGLLPADSLEPSPPMPSGSHHILDHYQADGIAGLISIRTVKYTTARAVAEAAVDLALLKLDRGRLACKTAVTPLP